MRVPLGVLLTRLPPAGAGALAGLATDIEAAGADAIWIADHLGWPLPMPECLSALGIVAAATSRCTIGSGVLQLALREPAAVAKAASFLNAASGGRMVLGVGAGEHRGEFERVGVPFDQRGALLDAGLQTIREWWGDTTSRYRAEPGGAVPIWIGGRSPAARRRAALVGDGWMPVFCTPEWFAAQGSLLDDAARSAGRDPRAITRAACVPIDPDGRGAEWLGELYSLPPEQFRRYLIPTSEGAAAFAAFAAAGAQQVIALIAGDDPTPAIHALASASP